MKDEEKQERKKAAFEAIIAAEQHFIRVVADKYGFEKGEFSFTATVNVFFAEDHEAVTLTYESYELNTEYDDDD